MTKKDYYTWEVIDEISKQLALFIPNQLTSDEVAINIWNKLNEMGVINSD